MNARVAFDTHAFVKRLEAAGVSLARAEALADAMGDIVLQSIAIKTDLREVDIGLLAEMKEIRSELKDMELRLTLRMAAMLVFFVAVLSALKIFA